MSHDVAKSGVSLAEYGLVLACLICLCIAALQNLGTRVNENMDVIAQKVKTIKVDPDMNPYPDTQVTGSGEAISQEYPAGSKPKSEPERLTIKPKQDLAESSP